MIVVDLLRAHHFVTGDATAVRQVISALAHLGDRGAAAKLRDAEPTPDAQARAARVALFQAASRSLEHLLKQHPPLFTLCERIFHNEQLDGNERICLAIVFEKVDPSAWHVEIDPATHKARIDLPARQG